MTTLRHQQNPGNGVDYNVVIAATAPTTAGGLVYAVTIIQDVQTWTVIRGHGDFLVMQTNVAACLDDVHPCPDVERLGSSVEALLSARNQMQEWLLRMLMLPGAKESRAVLTFLTESANIIPPQYDNVPWTLFTANGQVVPPTVAPAPAYSEPAPTPAPSGTVPAAEFTMDEMMDYMSENGEEGAPTQHDDSEDEDEYRPSLRYQPTDEIISEEDAMDFAQEVEMIEDIGSLAQSLGASHLGRSLMLQEEMSGGRAFPFHGYGNHQHEHGLQMGMTVTGMGRGGIGSAMESATPGLGGSFNQTKPESPPRLDAFKMIRVIGKGSFGKVFLVKEIKTGHMFALKVLKKDNIIKRNQVEHTKTERSVLGYVKHPFIVGMNMAFQSKHKLYFVLDYCAGGELFFHLGKIGKFPEPRSRFYAAEIILAISYVHSLDIIYRDLKPENVLLDAMGHIRLTDFGLSKEGISGSSAGANSFCGTPEYLAPEILNRQGHGRAVDWWSLGALLFEMLTGLPPFYCHDRERLFEKIRKSELHYPASLSEKAKDVLRGLLTKDPQRRLGSGPNDAEDIKRHPFFESINWEQLMRGEVPAPWKPNIAGSADTSQFDNEFTSMPIFSPQSMHRGSMFGQTPSNNPFEGFTFQDKVFHSPAQTQAGT